ncbi:Inositol polyphosphate 5-phosphatase OCRL-1 [Neolecta irregularis DAH-3]|uniref:Inositol polyphosphate 5-phosphatase OCRL-1 n=1 Tax=Neolecta irregularis (strain DAH-3) TaxID=1198029 RepID=A0A1U7LW90_NEOID|nr:Inositol polyphosphate 5-phosphatase OCRL-1 [Neolecta irregularis DAH-3]|eukprot:OLL26945.1 Inositol polyphosphate 5-phosphatase OCRL-1 [Neolecta irregularis DAH-3]
MHSQSARPFLAPLNSNFPYSSLGPVSPLLPSPASPGFKTGFIANVLKERRADYINRETIRIKIASWNMNGSLPSKPLDYWLASPDNLDLVVVGLQEVDLGTDAYIRLDDTRESLWNESIINALGENFEKICSQQLIGMLIIAYARNNLAPHIRNMSTTYAGCGLLGTLGNKGAVKVQFSIHDTNFCFVNSHLAAQPNQVERRNSDYSEISRKLNLSQLTDYDHLFWFGDLNYRVDLPNKDVREFILRNEHLLCLPFDQLNVQRKEGKAFHGCTEHQIKFKPTFKFDMDTHEYDTSEKDRVPSWTDRILWRSNGVTCLEYKSHPEFTQSDHKPVSATFDATVDLVVKEKEEHVRIDAIRQLDKWENENRPALEISQTSFQFGSVEFLEPKKMILVLSNHGSLPVEFEFLSNDQRGSYSNPWLSVQPHFGGIYPRGKLKLNITIMVDQTSVAKLNRGEEKLEDILVLHIKDGKDSFISVAGEFQPTCFGMSLIRLSCGSAREEPAKSSQWSIPREIWRMTDYLLKHGLGTEDLFLHKGLPEISAYLHRCLDNGEDFNHETITTCLKARGGFPENVQLGNHSMAAMLLLFLELLPEPVIPFNQYEVALKAAESSYRASQVRKGAQI